MSLSLSLSLFYYCHCRWRQTSALSHCPARRLTGVGFKSSPAVKTIVILIGLSINCWDDNCYYISIGLSIKPVMKIYMMKMDMTKMSMKKMKGFTYYLMINWSGRHYKNTHTVCLSRSGENSNKCRYCNYKSHCALKWRMHMITHTNWWTNSLKYIFALKTLQQFSFTGHFLVSSGEKANTLLLFGLRFL